MNPPVTNINRTSDVILIDWMIWEVNNKKHHLVGKNEATGEERVSTKVVTWDPITHKVLVGSGKIYKLRGMPEINPDSNKDWNSWQKINEVETALCVTSDYFVKMYEAYQERKAKQRLAA